MTAAAAAIMPKGAAHLPPNAGTVLGRLRNELQVSQSAVAAQVGLDQSRMSRMEKGEISNGSDVIRIIDALANLGSNDARRYKEFLYKHWRHVEQPDFWNPDVACIALAEETLSQIEDFMGETEPPWPLRRQLERQKTLLLNAAGYLADLTHQIAFIGDIGVGKSTALSFLYNLLLATKSDARLTDRVLLEAGGGGTTICEVHIRRGPEFGIAIQPMPEAELRQMVGDLCAAKWLQTHGKKDAEGGDTVGIGREIERAIRNMAGLTTRREKGAAGGKQIRRDLLAELVQRCASEDELRTKVLDAMKLHNRTKRDSWFDPGSGKVAMTWLADIFKSINNGRVRDISLPRRIDLFVPDFAAEQHELQISIIDTKGIDDLAVREDLDTRLRDARTAVVLCTRFNDAPSLTVRILLQHMRRTFAERFENGKLSILALPRTGEARAIKDDDGEFPHDDADGYELKNDQVARTLGGADDGLADIPIHFLNVEADDPRGIREAIVHQVLNMRKACATRVQNLCAAIDDLIEHHEAQAFSAAVEEVANQLRMFLESNSELKAREKHAYDEALKTVGQVRYAATLWASARRNGQYSGLSIGHQTGIGAAQDGLLRCHDWFSGIQMHLRTLKANPDLDLARKTIDEIAVSVAASRTDFAEALQTAGVEVYREPLQNANELWSSCAREWGQGPGFKRRVRNHLRLWFEKRSDLKDRLERLTHVLWTEKVITPVMRLAEEQSGNTGTSPSGNVESAPVPARVPTQARADSAGTPA